MKYLVLLLIILAILLWLSWRFRRQISAARQIWKMLADASRAANQQTGAGQPKQTIPAGKLVRCEKCGTWVTKDSALNFGNNTYFCSAQCIEKSVVNG